MKSPISIPRPAVDARKSAEVTVMKTTFPRTLPTTLGTVIPRPVSPPLIDTSSLSVHRPVG